MKTIGLEKITKSWWLKTGMIIVIFIGSAWLVNQMFRASLRAQWSFVDDQEIAYYLGSDHKLGLPEAWHIYVNETEIGKYGSYARFRPAYFAFRLLESWLWGDNLVLWHFAKLAILILFLSTFWFLLAEKIGFLIGGLITFFVGTSYYWIDIFMRLGPSEPYAVFGLALFALGVYLLYSPWNLSVSWFLICIGTMIMTGSKENLFPILLLLVFLVFERYKKHQVNSWGWIWLAVATVWNLWILSAIAIAVGRTGRDIYQQSVSVADRSSFLLAALKSWEVMALILLCLAFSIIGILARKREERVSTLSITLGAVLGFLLIVYLTQIIIYRGDFPNGDRYDFPGRLVIPLAVAVLIWYFQQIARLSRVRSYEAMVFVIALLVSTALAYSQVKGIRLAQRESRKYVRTTQEFTQDVTKLQSLAAQYPDHTLIFQANTPIDDYLFAFIYNPFLRYYGVSNPMAVLWAGGTPETYGQAEAAFIQDLQQASLYGGTVLTNVSLKPDFVPLAQTNGENCILLVLSADQPAKDCQVVEYWKQ